MGVETGNDDAWYLLLARSLRDLDYSDRHLLGAPAHSQYPPGFPALLALSTMMFGERIDALLGVMVLCSAISLAFVYDAVRRRSGPHVGLVVLALCAVNPRLIEFGGKLMSETPYLLFTSVAIWAVSREPTTHDSARSSAVWPAAPIVASVMAALTRTFGLTLIAALTVAWMLERRYRRAMVLAGAAVLTVGAWMFWTMAAPGRVATRSYIADATFVEEGSPSPVAAIARRISENSTMYATRSIPSALPQPTIEGTLADNIIGLLLFVVFAAVGVFVLWKQARAVVLYLATSAALLAIWPWRVDRFVVPLIPFLLWMMMTGVFTMSRHRRWLRPLPVVVLSGVVATAVAQNLTWLRATSDCDRDEARTSPGCFGPAQQGFFAAASFARRQTPDTAVFFTIRDATFAYVAHRRILHSTRLHAQDARALLPELRRRGVSYVLLSPLQPADVMHVRWLLQSCGQLHKIAEFSGRTLLLGVKPEPTDTPTNSCADLQLYLQTEATERDRVLRHPRVR